MITNVQHILTVLQRITGPDVITLFSYSTQLSTKLIVLKNVRMPTIVGNSTFISMINTTPERLKEEKKTKKNLIIFRYFSFYEQLKFRAQLSWAWKKIYNLGARSLPQLELRVRPPSALQRNTIYDVSHAWKRWPASRWLLGCYMYNRILTCGPLSYWQI